jgi:hypothetical protein
MAKQKNKTRAPEESSLEFGEKRLGMQASARAYFFYVSPTGQETGMNKCPHLRITWSRGGNQDQDGTRIMEWGILASMPITLKMACMHTAFGKPTNRKFIYLDLHPDAERLSITGPGDFGTFLGRAKINVEKSGIPMAEIKKNFKIEVLAMAAAGQGDDVRSLIF